MRWTSRLQFSVPSSRLPVEGGLRGTASWEPRTKILAILLASVTFLSATPPSDEAHISVYSPVANYTLPVLERGGREYVGLLELLEPLGRVSTESNNRTLHLRYNAVDADFVAGKTRAKIHGRDFDF